MIANEIAPRSVSSFFMSAAAFAAVLLAIVVPLLLDLGYSVFDAEVWFFGGIACCLAAVFGWIDTQSIRLGAVLLAMLTYAVTDLYLVRSDLLGLAVFAGLFLLALSPAQTTLRIISAVFCLTFITTSMFSAENRLFRSIEGAERSAQVLPASQAAAKLPAIVHIVLDELASLSRMPDVLPLRTLMKTIEADYLNRGFALFPSTRSTSGSSAISLSELVAPRGQRYGNEKELDSKNKATVFQVPVNDYFAKLKRQGYRISVIQSSHLDFCGKEASHCLTYERAEFIDAAFRYGKTLIERLRTAGAVMHARASAKFGDRTVILYSYAVQGLDYVGIPGMAQRGAADEKVWSPSGMSLRVFDYLDARFASPKPGETYFIHLLLPHFPFVLDRNCNINPPSKWRWPLWAPESAIAGTALGAIYAAYGEQLQCTHSRTMRLIDAMMKSTGGSQTIFIVHGDHGARIHSKIRHLDRSKQSEPILMDGLDTFFAVKAPGMDARVNKQQELLQVRFRDILENHILTPMAR